MEIQYESILWQQEGSIGLITLNRPETFNALGREINHDLWDLVGRIKDSSDLQVLILTGAGKAFSAGGDMQAFLNQIETNQKTGGALPLFVNALARRFLDIEIPIIAAMNGPAVGGGLTLSLTCDLRIASENAKFGAVFTRAGLSPEYGSSFLLSRIVGLTKASEWILTARMIDAPEALASGLVSEVTPPEQLMDRARALAEQIAALPPLATRVAKRTLRHGLDATLAQALDYEEMVFTYCQGSQDHYEAVQAFIEKRPAKFRGR